MNATVDSGQVDVLKSVMQFSSSYHTMIIFRAWEQFDLTLLNSLHGLWNCEIGGLDCHVIITEYSTYVQCIHM